MGRFQQSKGERGSQKWLQEAVNVNPMVLDRLILPHLSGASTLTWLSPLAADHYAEYRDAEFLGKIGASQLTIELANFWPDWGPQWDALARSERGEILMVEAKAHIDELCSKATQAGPVSRTKIEEALRETSSYLGAQLRASWSDLFYQLTNRIAHLYFLRKHGLDAWLILVNFIGDGDMKGPMTAAEWEAAYEIVWYVLGLVKDHKLRRYIVDIYPSVTPQVNA
ncbi:MAG TPA: hypothetical protein VH640_11080 [Bryobacteraceae bacterium]|jgi:hypothetical protein